MKLHSVHQIRLNSLNNILNSFLNNNWRLSSVGRCSLKEKDFRNFSHKRNNYSQFITITFHHAFVRVHGGGVTVRIGLAIEAEHFYLQPISPHNIIQAAQKKHALMLFGRNMIALSSSRHQAKPTTRYLS